MRLAAKSLPSIRLSRRRQRHLCFVWLPQSGRRPSNFAHELVLIVSLAAPHLRWLVVFESQRSPVLDDTPRAA